MDNDMNNNMNMNNSINNMNINNNQTKKEKSLLEKVSRVFVYLEFLSNKHIMQPFRANGSYRVGHDVTPVSTMAGMSAIIQFFSPTHDRDVEQRPLPWLPFVKRFILSEK